VIQLSDTQSIKALYDQVVAGWKLAFPNDPPNAAAIQTVTAIVLVDEADLNEYTLAEIAGVFQKMKLNAPMWAALTRGDVDALTRLQFVGGDAGNANAEALRIAQAGAAVAAATGEPWVAKQGGAAGDAPKTKWWLWLGGGVLAVAGVGGAYLLATRSRQAGGGALAGAPNPLPPGARYKVKFPPGVVDGIVAVGAEMYGEKYRFNEAGSTIEFTPTPLGEFEKYLKSALRDKDLIADSPEELANIALALQAVQSARAGAPNPAHLSAARSPRDPGGTLSPIFKAASGKKWRLRIVRYGDYWGRENAMRHESAGYDLGPLVVFYDYDYKSKKDPWGQLTPGSYYAKTLLEDRPGRCKSGLTLYGSEPRWDIDGETYCKMIDWIKANK
jgi:hypothetical protein